MASDASRRPPPTVFPWAGVWADWIAEAMEIGLSPAERREPTIAKALDGFRGRSIERIVAGETVGTKTTDALIGSLKVLVCIPRWSPLHNVPSADCERLLRHAFGGLERLAAHMTACPNAGGVLSRAMLRLWIVQSALTLGGLSWREQRPPVEFHPWKPKEGFGRVIRDLARGFSPPRKRHEIVEILGVSESVWDRLLQGIIPSGVGFDFDRFSQLVSDENIRSDIGTALRRAFAWRLLIMRMRDGLSEWVESPVFWETCWCEYARIHAVAAAQSKLMSDAGQEPRMGPARTIAAAGAAGIWRHTFIGLDDWPAHLETVANAAAAVVERGGQPDDEVVARLLDAYSCIPEATLLECARRASGTPKAIEFLLRIPDTFRRDLVLGREYMVQGCMTEARACFEKGFACASSEWEAVLDLAWFEARHGDAGRALTLLRVSCHTEQKEYPLVEGEALYRLSRYAEALAAFTHSINRGHAQAHATGRAALCCHHLGRKADATNYARTCERLSGTNPLLQTK